MDKSGTQQTGNLNISGTGVFAGKIGVGTPTPVAKAQVSGMELNSQLGSGISSALKIVNTSSDFGVQLIIVTAQGTGYTTPPMVTISGGGGGGATATAFVSNGGVIGVRIDNPGAGYTSRPDVTFGVPGTGASAVALIYGRFAELQFGQSDNGRFASIAAQPNELTANTTGDVVLGSRVAAADNQLAEVVRFTNTFAQRQTRFSGPVFIDFPPTGLTNAANVGEMIRIHARVHPAANFVPTYAGLNVTNAVGGNDLAMNAFYHAIQANIATKASSPNQIAGVESFVTGYGTADLFGGEFTPQVDATAPAGGIANIVGVSSNIGNNRKTANEGAIYGFLMSQNSTGQPPSAGGFAWGVFIQRNQMLGTPNANYTAGTVTGALLGSLLTGSGTFWLTAGPPPFFNFVNKKLKIAGDSTIYTITAVSTDTSLSVSPNLNSAPVGATYQIRTTEPWDREVFIRDASNEAIRIAQDVNFPPPLTNYAFRLRNASDTGDNMGINFGGGYTFRGNQSMSPVIQIKPQTGTGYAYIETTPVGSLAGFQDAIFVDRTTTGTVEGLFEALTLGADLFATNLFHIRTHAGGGGQLRPLALGIGASEALRIDTTLNVGIGTPSPGTRLEVNGGVTGQTLKLTSMAPTVGVGQVGLGSTTQTTVGPAGAATALPTNPTGYLVVNIGGASKVLPFYDAV